jgi:hypothetical protein
MAASGGSPARISADELERSASGEFFDNQFERQIDTFSARPPDWCEMCLASD